MKSSPFAWIVAATVAVTSPIYSASAQSDELRQCQQDCWAQYNQGMQDCDQKWGTWRSEKEYCQLDVGRNNDSCQQVCNDSFPTTAAYNPQDERFRPDDMITRKALI